MRLKVTGSIEDIADSIANNYVETTEKLRVLTETSAVERDKVAARFKALQPRVAERQRISELHKRRYEARLREMELARADFLKADDRLAKLNTDVSTSRTKHAQTIAQIAEAQRSLERIKSEHGETPDRNKFIGLSKMLKSVAHYVDHSVEIVYEDNKFKWTTAPIYIKDRDNSVLPLNFGRFEVTLTSEGGRLNATFKPLEPVLRSGYCHPHITENGSPCLGNAGALMLRALTTGDITGAIQVSNEYLVNYNILNPYKHLDVWVDCLWHNPACPCGLFTVRRCGCDRCPGCSNMPGVEVQESANGCGWCHNCCRQVHVSCASSATHGLGINGSSCSISRPNTTGGSTVYFR